MSMDAFLAEYYGTKTASAEDFEKQAQVELFAKLAAANGIDLEALSPAQVQYLWASTFSKTAEEEEKDKEEKDKESEGEDDDKKVEEAKKEHEEKKEAMAKIAEADYLGRVMAHSMVRELRDLDGNFSKNAGAGDKLKEFGSKALDAIKKTPGRLAGSKDQLRNLATKANDLEMMAQGASSSGQRHLRGAAQRALDAAKAEQNAVRNTRLAVSGLGAAAAAGGGAAAYYGKKDKEKKSSAIDELSSVAALHKAAAAGWDPEEAAARIDAVVVLGSAGESEKIAHAVDLDGAVDVRSLELLEAAGYPVTWE